MKPAWWQVVIVGFCAAGTTLAYALGSFDRQWAGWLALFLAMELGAAASRECGDTFSERLWNWLGVRPVRQGRWWRCGAIVLFLAELSAHFVLGSGHWWTSEWAVVVTATPLAVAMVTGALRHRRNRWSRAL